MTQKYSSFEKVSPAQFLTDKFKPRDLKSRRDQSRSRLRPLDLSRSVFKTYQDFLDCQDKIYFTFQSYRMYDSFQNHQEIRKKILKQSTNDNVFKCSQVTGDFVSMFNLHIHRVQQEDQGQYMCQINTDPMMQQVFLVRFLVRILVELLNRSHFRDPTTILLLRGRFD